MNEKYNGFPINNNEDQEIKLENEASFEAVVDAADKAVIELSLDLKRGERFPGADAYNKVLKVMELLASDEEILETWKDSYGEWEKRFDDEDKDVALEELRSLLQGALASSKRKITLEV